ncbi:MAG: hypothetical protein ACWA5Q_04240 [bacterium]
MFKNNETSVNDSRRPGLLLLISLLSAIATNSCLAADDDYLSALEAESGKVEQGLDDDEAQKKLSDLEGQRAAFEKLLEDQYRGTYVFYKRLTERSKQEVFLRYAGGASIPEVRSMIVDRSMQR